jgi:Flp pilus assembly protein TadG
MKRPRSARRGAAAVELAILLPFLALAASAALDFGRVFHATQVLDTAASTGAQYASGTAWVPLSTTTPSDAARAAAVAEGASLNPPLAANDVDVTVAGNVATVAVSHDFPLLTGVLFPSRSVHLRRTAVVRIAPRPGD